MSENNKVDKYINEYFDRKNNVLETNELFRMIEEAMGDSEQEIEESSNVGGFAYENDVIAVLNSLGISGNITSGAGASAAAADADMTIDGKIYNIEVKLNKNAQMGGTSLRYFPKGNEEGDKFDIVSKTIEEDTVEMMEEALMPTVPSLNKFLRKIGAKKLPATIERDRWVEAVAVGLLKPLNVKIRRTTKFIINHYKKKGIDYIQIGGAGLFYLAGNPANLPIPQLDGEIDIELRPGRSGSKTRKDGTVVVGAGIRVQGRLKFKGISPYTLDDPDSIKEMLGTLEEELYTEQPSKSIVTNDLFKMIEEAMSGIKTQVKKYK